MLGTIAIFFGIAMVAPFVIRPLVRALSWPLRLLFPVEGRLAADAARSDPGRTAATATGVDDRPRPRRRGEQPRLQLPELDLRRVRPQLRPRPHRSAARLRARRGTAADDRPKGLRDRLAQIPEAEVVARERFLFTPDLPVAEGEGRPTACCSRSRPEQYEQVDADRHRGRAARGRRSRRIERGEVTDRQGPRRRDRTRGRRPRSSSTARRERAGRASPGSSRRSSSAARR